MKALFAFSLVVLFASTSLAVPMRDTAHGDAITEIRLKRTACFGECPVDEVILRADGKATYIGERYAERIGQYKGAINTYFFARLAQWIKAQKFFDLKDYYQHGEFRATDQESVFITVVNDGNRKTVESYGGAGPLALWGIERVLLGVSKDIKWQGEDSGLHVRATWAPEAIPEPQLPSYGILRVRPTTGGRDFVRPLNRDAEFQVPLAPGEYEVTFMAVSTESKKIRIVEPGKMTEMRILWGQRPD